MDGIPPINFSLLDGDESVVFSPPLDGVADKGIKSSFAELRVYATKDFTVGEVVDYRRLFEILLPKRLLLTKQEKHEKKEREANELKEITQKEEQYKQRFLQKLSDNINFGEDSWQENGSCIITEIKERSETPE